MAVEDRGLGLRPLSVWTTAAVRSSAAGTEAASGEPASESELHVQATDETWRTMRSADTFF